MTRGRPRPEREIGDMLINRYIDIYRETETERERERGRKRVRERSGRKN